MDISTSPADWVTDPSRPLAEGLRALAPLHLPNRRSVRYFGDNLCLSLDTLAGRDERLVRKLYDVLTELLFALADLATDDAHKWHELALWTARHDLDSLIDDVRALGVDSHVRGAGETLSKVMHDLRGGALSALLGRLQLLDRLPALPEELNTIFILTRDHLKIMRSAVVGLDEPRRDADRQPKSHDINLILDKWHGSVVGPKWQEAPIRLFIDCRYRGALTECCLESAAIDRIFYNLANNAARHSANQRLEMTIFPVPQVPGESLRIVLSNEVSEHDAQALRLLTAGHADSADKGIGLSLLSLFEPQVSSTGSGFGLAVVADFVAGAFGLQDRQEALRERYVGAILDGRTFRVWFHWPIADGSLPPKLDDYRRPAQSLSEP